MNNDDDEFFVDDLDRFEAKDDDAGADADDEDDDDASFDEDVKEYPRDAEIICLG